MPGCIQPMSSPMMKRIFGLAGVCAAAGVTTAPGSAASIVAPSRAAHKLLCDPSALPKTAGSEDNLELCMQSGMTSFSRLLRSDGFSSDASKAEMACGGIDRLRMARCRPVTSAVVRRAQMRAAFDDLPWDLHICRSGIEAVGLGAAARILRNAAGL